MPKTVPRKADSRFKIRFQPGLIEGARLLKYVGLCRNSYSQNTPFSLGSTKMLLLDAAIHNHRPDNEVLNVIWRS